MPQLLCLLAAVLLSWIALPAADSEAGLADAVKTLHRKALEEHDLWTCFQLEAYGQRRDLRLPASLGRGGQIHGDPILSYPETVIDVVTRGEHQLVVAGARYYPVASDGRPLGLSQPLPFTPQLLSASPDTRFLAICAITGTDAKPLLRLAVQDLQRDARKWYQAEQRPALAAGTSEDVYRLVVSADGSAVGAVLRRSSDLATVFSLVVASKAGVTTVPGIRDVFALGPMGTWVLASDQEGNSGCFLAGKLVHPAPLGRRAAAGGGVAVLLDKDLNLQLLAADGSITAWKPANLDGEILHLRSMGEWLVVSHLLPKGVQLPTQSMPAESVDLFAPPPATGSADSADLFAADTAPAQEATPESEQLSAVTLYAWQDLAKRPKGAAALHFSGQSCMADTHGQALWLWQGNQLSLLDLNGPAPQQQAMTALPAAMQSLSPSHTAYIGRLADGSSIILDHQARPLYHLSDSSGLRLEVLSRDAALAYTPDAKEQHLLVLDRDPEQRRDCLLADWPAEYTYAYARATDDAKTLVVGVASAWQSYDTTTGRVLDRHAGPGVRPLPDTSSLRDNLGRMSPTLRHSHLIPVADPSHGSTTPWTVSDAIPAGRTMLILSTDGSLHAEDRNGWQELARHHGLRRFVDIPGENGLFLGVNDHTALAELVPGRGLTIFPAPKRTQARHHGSWAVDGLRFTAPGSAGMLSWDHERFSFAPQRLQGEGRSALLAFFPGIVLQLDARTAAALGVDDQTRSEREASRSESRSARARPRR